MIIKLIIPYYLEQDNISEHVICIIIKKARTVFNNQSILDFLWSYIVDIIIYITNRIIILVLERIIL
jgi:hypothetical protein